MSTILGYECVFDNQKEEWLSIRDTVLCLNELADENEQLKKENRELEKFRYSVFKNLHTITEKDEHIAWKRGCE